MINMRSSDLTLLKKCLQSCNTCALSPQQCENKYVVIPSGPLSSFMIVGEAPGADEDEAAEPFVGRSGQLLDTLLKKAKIKREQVYITNVVKCRPYTKKGKFKSNRTPTKREILSCDWLEREIALIKPKVVVPLGATALRAVCGDLPKTLKLGDYIGTQMDEGYGYVTVPCYHPSYLMQHGRKFMDTAVKALALARKVAQGNA